MLGHESMLHSEDFLYRLPLRERIVPPVSTHPDRQSYTP